MNKIGLALFFLFTLICNIKSQSIGKIDEQILNAIVNIDNSGTGFLVAKSDPNNKENKKIFLVTNKHMIGEWSMVDSLIPKPSILVYLYSQNEGTPVIPIKIDLLDKDNKLLPSVKAHPNHKIDIVVIEITKQIELTEAIDNFDIGFFTMSYLIPLDSISTQTYIGLGDQVFAIGYPAGITSIKTNKPIVKSSYISSPLSGDLVINTPWKDRSNKTIISSAEGKFFLVDGLIIGGNSGGPIVHPKERKVKMTNGQIYYTEEEIPNLVFGIVSFCLPNTGITTIYACDHIIELVNEFKFK